MEFNNGSGESEMDLTNLPENRSQTATLVLPTNDDLNMKGVTRYFSRKMTHGLSSMIGFSTRTFRTNSPFNCRCCTSRVFRGPVRPHICSRDQIHRSCPIHPVPHPFGQNVSGKRRNPCRRVERIGSGIDAPAPRDFAKLPASCQRCRDRSPS